MWSLVDNPHPSLRTLRQISYIRELPGVSPKHPEQDCAQRNHPKKHGEEIRKEGGKAVCVSCLFLFLLSPGRALNWKDHRKAPRSQKLRCRGL